MYYIKFIITPAKLDKSIEKEILDTIEIMKNKSTEKNIKLEYKIRTEKDGIYVEINSDAYCATDFLTQLDKLIRDNLGKKFRITINDIKIIEYKIETEITESPKKELTVPFVKKLEFQKDRLKLYYDKLNFANIKDQYVEKTIKLIKEKIKMQNYDGKDEFKEYVWESKQKECKYNGDPAVDLEKNGWIKRTDAKGQFVYGRKFTALVNVIKELYTEQIYSKLEFYEMIFPKFEPWAVPMKSGHAKTVYPNAYFVNVPRVSSNEEWQDVMDIYEITGEIPKDIIKEKTNCVGIMSYAQCPPFWPFLCGRVIEKETLPLLVYDWSGPTYRNEAGGTHGLDRVEELHRIETLYVGTKEQVIEIWKKLKEMFIEFYDKSLDLEIKVANVTPWWMTHAGVNTESGDKDIGTFDIDAYLPYRGNRSKEWLEIQNVSSNGDKYPKAFNVKEKSREYLWSGCAGTSLQRIVVSFLAQKGLDHNYWPKEIKKRFTENTKNIKDLKFY